MFRDLWTLIKMLFKSDPSEINTVELMEMEYFPFKRYSYMMWCGKMIYRKDDLANRKKEWSTNSFRYIMNHENIHLMQAKVCGSWVRYYWRYCIEWLKGNPIFGKASVAYITNPFESEAYVNEKDLHYCNVYEGSNLLKYDFSKRQKVYANAGGTASSWVKYLKRIV